MKHIIDYSTILPEFCAQRCTAPSIFGNGGPLETNPRIIYLRKLLSELDLDYEMDSWTMNGYRPNPITRQREPTVLHFHNIYLVGTSRAIVMAHHDIVNIDSDNCNDNSASVINAIAAKILNPELTVIITDCEEFGGKGSERAAQKISAGYFGEIDFILNLELTAVGGRSFFTENYPNSRLFQKIQRLFPNTPTVNVPFHDGIILRHYGLDSVVLNPLPKDENGRMKMELLNLCHSERDVIANANYDDMDTFVRYVVTPLIKEELSLN